MKKTAMILLMTLCLLLPVMANGESARYTPAAPVQEAKAEDYAGEWICLYASITGEVIDTESHLDELGMESVLTVSVEGAEATFSGLPELGPGALPVVFSEGAMYFEPEEGIRVLTLRMLEDGAMVMNFSMMEFAPTLYLFRSGADRVPGDANGDGAIDLKDALCILMKECGKSVRIVEINADVNGDGMADMKDALLIGQYAAGWNVEMK